MPRLLLATLALLLAVTTAGAGTQCQTRKSGSVTITTCSGSDGHSECRSYQSGSVTKTGCR